MTQTRTPVTLEALSQWCLAATIGAVENFALSTELSQDEASRLAFDLNQKRPAGHVWIGVEGTGFGPELTTLLDVRCSH